MERSGRRIYLVLVHHAARGVGHLGEGVADGEGDVLPGERLPRLRVLLQGECLAAGRFGSTPGGKETNGWDGEGGAYLTAGVI